MKIALIFMCLAIALLIVCVVCLIIEINKLNNFIDTTYLNICSMFTSIEDQLDYFDGLLVTDLHERESAGKENDEME